MGCTAGRQGLPRLRCAAAALRPALGGLPGPTGHLLQRCPRTHQLRTVIPFLRGTRPQVGHIKGNSEEVQWRLNPGRT